MKKEIEAKSIKINKEDIRNKLKDLGAKLIFKEKEFTRKTYELPKSSKLSKQSFTWIRLRTDGKRTTLTLKISGKTIDSVREVNCEVKDFGVINEFLKLTGFTLKSTQINLRERWLLDDVKFDIDTWPLIDPWIEIEADTEEKVRKHFKLLNLDYSKAYFGSADIVYQEVYNIDILNMPNLNFKTKLNGNRKTI